MAGKPPENGPTGLTVAANVRRLREDMNLSYTQLAQRLDALGYPMKPVTVRRLESGERRIGVDDLVAFAVAFDVTPNTLLMPPDVVEADLVELTGLSGHAAYAVWGWLVARLPVPGRRLQSLLTWPAWRKTRCCWTWYRAARAVTATAARLR